MYCAVRKCVIVNRSDDCGLPWHCEVKIIFIFSFKTIFIKLHYLLFHNETNFSICHTNFKSNQASDKYVNSNAIVIYDVWMLMINSLKLIRTAAIHAFPISFK